MSAAIVLIVAFCVGSLLGFLLAAILAAGASGADPCKHGPKCVECQAERVMRAEVKRKCPVCQLGDAGTPDDPCSVCDYPVGYGA